MYYDFIIKIYAFFIIVDCYNVMMQSILRGCGNQHIPSIWNILSTVFITIPTAYLLAFYFNYGLIGLWIGVFTFQFVMLVISSIYVLRLNFETECEKLHKDLIVRKSSILGTEIEA